MLNFSRNVPNLGSSNWVSTVYLHSGATKSFGSMFGVADTGNYTCVATNKLGDSSSVAFELIVNQAADNDTSTGGATTGMCFI